MRLAGVNIPDEKRIDVALTYIFGIGRERAKNILNTVNIPAEKRAKELSTDETNTIKEFIEKSFKIEGDLRREVRDNIKRKIEIDSYQGLRHKRGLPVRGQQTRPNNRTVRGNVRKTMGSGRKPTAQKT